MQDIAIYDAWCDRVSVIVVGGNDLDPSKRPAGRSQRFTPRKTRTLLVRPIPRSRDEPARFLSVISPHPWPEHTASAMTPPYEPVAVPLERRPARRTQSPPRSARNSETRSKRYAPQADVSGSPRCRAACSSTRPIPSYVTERTARAAAGMRLRDRACRSPAGASLGPARAGQHRRQHHLHQFFARKLPSSRSRTSLSALRFRISRTLSMRLFDDGEDSGAGIQARRTRDRRERKLISIS